MDEEFFVFDSDFINKRIFCIDKCTFVRSSASYKYNKLYITKNPDKICDCSILVVKIDPGTLVNAKKLRDDVKCTIYTTNISKAISRIFEDDIPENCTILYINKTVTRFYHNDEDNLHMRLGGVFKFVRPAKTSAQRALDGVNMLLSSYHYLRMTSLGKRVKGLMMKGSPVLSEEVRRQASIWASNARDSYVNKVVNNFITTTKSISGGYSLNCKQECQEPLFFPRISEDSGMFMCSNQVLMTRTSVMSNTMLEDSSEDSEEEIVLVEREEQSNPLLNIRDILGDDD